MSALLVNFKIEDFQEMLDEIDNYTVVLKDDNKNDVEVITIDSLTELLEQYVNYKIIDLDK